MSFIQELDPTIITLNNIRMYQGTDMYKNPSKYGLKLEDNYWFEKDLWIKKTVCGTKDLSCERIDYWMRKIMENFIKSNYIGE